MCSHTLWILSYVLDGNIINYLCQSRAHAEQVASAKILNPIRSVLEYEETPTDEWLIEHAADWTEYGEDITIQPVTLEPGVGEAEGQETLPHCSRNLKMYILLKTRVSPLEPDVYSTSKVRPGTLATVAAHASLACFIKYQDQPEMQRWIQSNSVKILCSANDATFEQAKQYPCHVVLTEYSLEDAEVAIAFAPRERWSSFFKTLALYR